MREYKKKKGVRTVDIPTNIFRDRELSVLETMIAYLREEHGLKYSEIAKILNRDDRTIWTSYNRVKKKRKRKGGKA